MKFSELHLSEAVSKGIDVFQPATYKDDQVFDQYKALKPDLTVMAFVTDIIPERFFEVPTHGTINYHPSILPRHRGASAINWAVIMGDTRTGLSIFWPDGGIDTGFILLQKEIEIGPDDTTGSLYFNHLFPMGVDAILESIDLVKAGKAPKIAQDEDRKTYIQCKTNMRYQGGCCAGITDSGYHDLHGFVSAIEGRNGLGTGTTTNRLSSVLMVVDTRFRDST